MKTLGTVSFAFVLVASWGLETRGASPAPRLITFTSVTITPAAAASRTVGSNIQFAITATGSAGTLSYQMDFGDGTPPTAFQVSNTFNHVYAVPGHFSAIINIQEVGGATFSTDNVPKQNPPVTIIHPLTSVKPTNSSTIILDTTRNRIWVVNPDQDTVSTFLTSGLPAPTVTELPVGKNPRTLAQAGDGTIWVVSQTHPSISIFEPTAPFALQHVIPLPHGSAPYGIAMNTDGSAAYVTFQGSGGVRMISTTSLATLANTSIPPSARGVSVTADGRVLVSRFISPQSNPILLHNAAAFTDPLTGNRGEVVEFGSSLNTVRTFSLRIDPGLPAADPDFGAGAPPNANTSRGVPNYITSLVVTPDGRRAWVPSKKDNVQRGTGPLRDTLLPGPEVTYRAIVSGIDLLTNANPPLIGPTDRVDINDAEMPQAACTSPLGDYLFIALQGTNRVQIRDLYKMDTGILNGVGSPTGTGPTNGLAPQGLVIDPATNRLFIQNYMGRTVSVIDMTSVINWNFFSPLVVPAPLAVVTTVTATDLLPVAVLQGKRVFYNAGDPRMSLNGYVSCAGCHLDGGSDMRVWDFTNRTEGFRNTVMLQGRGNGTGQKHGNVHWSANFNEIQDFENDVRNAFGGTGLGPAIHPPMSATPNAGGDLDTLAAYVNSLDKVARSPFRNADGTLTAAAAAGEAVFKAQDCQQCHGGREFTNSTIFTNAAMPAIGNGFHNVGTIKSTSGKRLGLPAAGTLAGMDTPTLKGVWQTAPFFHDGSALTMADVINTVPNTVPTAHGSMHLLSAADRANLERYMIEIDEIDAPPVPSTQVNTVTLGAIGSGRPYSFAPTGTASNVLLPFVDRSYTIGAIPALLQNKILLRTAEDDKDFSGSSLITFTLTSAANVYVFLDNRAGVNRPTWLDLTWTADAPRNLTISPGLVMLAFVKNFAAGSVTLGGNQQGGPTGALRNYFVIIDQAAAVFEEGPLSRGEWVHDQDGDGDGLRDEFEAVTASAVAGLSPWDSDSGPTLNVADEDELNGGVTLFTAQPPLSTGGPIGGGGGGGGGCGLGGLEFLIPLLALRLLRRRSPVVRA